MLNENSPVTFADALPTEVDVVVIGGGVIGVSTAWFLAQRGVSVLVCEKGRISGEQSSRNWGWIRKHGRDPAELPIVIESVEHWESISREVPEDIGFARHGVLYLAENERELAVRERWLTVAKDHDLDTRMLGKSELSKLFKDTPHHWIGGAFTPSDARAEPFIAVPALARAAQRKGVDLIENCAVRCIDVAAGRVDGVVTEQGLVRCSSVVCAGGAWASMFCRNLGYDFPQLTVRATVARTAPAVEIFNGSAASSRLAFRRRSDDGYTLAANGYFDHFVSRDSFRYLHPFVPSVKRSFGNYKLRFGIDLFERLRTTKPWSGDTVSPFEKTRVLNPAPSASAIDAIAIQVKRELPKLAGVPLVQSWAGMIDTTPDVVPVMDRIEQIPGMFVAAGFSGHGFGIGPGAGRVMADMIIGNTLGHDMSRFRIGRFSDGSKLELVPTI
jgi:glycine/D-amino acid oxidase-like deaminating enzyme